MSVLLEDGANRLEAGDDVLTVVGSVDFDGAAALAEAGRHWLEGRSRGGRVAFDLKGVDRVSSAAVSVLLEWLRQAHRTGLDVGDVRLSAPLARLTEVADLNSLLPIVAPVEAGR
ncbi:STAS domain-containing protein [Halomonas elongata]|uniref:STAS domain-containing protein n=1 Tax=Halomonas elongata TaxID=2746 RepID=UPI0023AF297A|nr:STAS domain-containing protein [Halomonas elongata]